MKGTVNDAAETFEAHKAHGSYHWTFERLLSAGLIPIMGGAAVSTGSAYASFTLSFFLGLTFYHSSQIPTLPIYPPRLAFEWGLTDLADLGWTIGCLVDYS